MVQGQGHRNRSFFSFPYKSKTKTQQLFRLIRLPFLDKILKKAKYLTFGFDASKREQMFSHNSIGELEIDGIPWLWGDLFSSFIFVLFLSIFCFPCMKTHASRKSFREGKGLALFISHRLLEEQSYGTLYKHNDPVCFKSKLNWCFICTKGYRSRLTLVTGVTGGIKRTQEWDCFIDIS